ncbi:MAG: hypothetical protein QOJ69_1682 [Actinomycetota bacterium]|nr:hypothetical protein [Actinomycetota bacterium]
MTTWVLVVLTALSVLVSTVAYWAHRTVFDQDRYVGLVVPLADDPAVKAALTTYLTDQIVTVLDLDQRIADALGEIPQLPKRVPQLIAGPVANMGNDRVAKEVTRFVDSQAFRDLWHQINAVGHEKIVALLRADYDKLPNLKLEGEEVRVNLLPVVAEVLQRVVQAGVSLVVSGVTIPDISVSEIPDAARQELSSLLGITLPEHFGEVTVMSKTNLDDAQAFVGRLDRLIWALVFLTLGLAVATVLVAVNRRRGLVQLALGVSVGLLLAAVAIRRVKEELVGRVGSEKARGAVDSVVSATLASLRDVGWIILVAAVLIGMVAYLAGRPRWLRAILGHGRSAARDPRLLAAVAAYVDGFRIAGVVLALLVLVLMGIGVLQLVLVAGALGVYLWAVEEARKAAPAPVEPVS